MSTIAQDVAASVLGAAFQRVQEELERSRQETSRVTRAHEQTQEKLAQERSTSVVRTTERDEVVSFVKEVAEYAAEATQKVADLTRTSNAQVTQAKHLFEHVRLAERQIDEMDSEKQQYAVDGTILGKANSRHRGAG